MQRLFSGRRLKTRRFVLTFTRRCPGVPTAASTASTVVVTIVVYWSQPLLSLETCTLELRALR